MGTRERREREKQQRRRAILDAARELFWKQGYSGTTMPLIARAAELAPGTLYLYFPSKSALYAEILIESYDELIPRLRNVAAAPNPPRAQAEALIDAFMQFAMQCPEHFDIIFFLLQRDGRLPRQERLKPDQLERLVAKETECKMITAAALHQLDLGEGEPRPKVDAIWSMLAGVVFFFGVDGAETFTAVAREAKKLVLDALFARG